MSDSRISAGLQQLKCFLVFTKPQMNTVPLQSKVTLIGLYIIFLASAIAVPGNCIEDYLAGDLVSAATQGVYLILLLTGLIVFWITRNLRAVCTVYSIGILTLIIGMIFSHGGPYGLGFLYLIAGYSILYFVLGVWGGIVLPAAIFAGAEAPEAAANLPEGWQAISVVQATITQLLNAFDLSIMNPQLLGGVFIGAMLAFLFCGMTMRAVGRSAGKMVNEVRRQFDKLRQALMDDGMSEEEANDPDNWPERVEAEGEEIPNYAHCVDIATAGALREMVVPSLLAIVVPVVVGIFLGVTGVMGLLAGALTCGFSLACMLNNSGGSWDNAKKWIEKGNLGGKGSEPHKASVVGDTVGDPFKDTSGPSLNILIKLTAMVSVAFAGLIVTVSPVVQSYLGLGGS